MNLYELYRNIIHALHWAYFKCIISKERERERERLGFKIPCKNKSSFINYKTKILLK